MNDKPKYSGYRVSKDKFAWLFGQNKIRIRLELLAELAPKALKNKTNINVLFNARTGNGKTLFSEFYLNMLWNVEKHDIIRWIPSDECQSIEIPDKVKYIFIDECHLIKNPEWLYPYLDRHDKVFIMATNDVGSLNPALLNGRLLEQVFEEYSDDDLILMAHNALDESRKEIPYDLYLRIVKAAKRNPRRIVHKICAEINAYNLDISTLSKFNTAMDFLGYDEKGFDPQERLYINFLKSRPNSGILTISACTGITKKTIENTIEPDLISQGIIEKTGKGRRLL